MTGEGAPLTLLVRMPNWLGDGIMAMPALRYLKERLPGLRLFLAARRQFAGLFGMQPEADGMVEAPASGLAPLFAGLWRGRKSLDGFTERLNAGLLLTNSFSTALWLRRLDPAIMVGFDLDWRRFLLTHPVPCGAAERSLHFVQYYLLLAKYLEKVLAEECGATPRQIDTGTDFYLPRLSVSETAAARAAEAVGAAGLTGEYAVFAPASAYGAVKDWPAAHYRRLAEELDREFSLPVAVTGSAGQAGACEAVCKGMRNTVNLAGRTPLEDFAGLVAGAKLFVGGDSGGAHLAAAFGIPTLVIFGITNPSRTRPVGKKVRLLGAGEAKDVKLRRASVRQAARAALEAIRPEEALSATREMLGGG